MPARIKIDPIATNFFEVSPRDIFYIREPNKNIIKCVLNAAKSEQLIHTHWQVKAVAAFNISYYLQMTRN